MSLKTVTRCLVALGCVGAFSLYAQTTATTATTTTTHKVEHKAKTEVKETKTETKAETKAVEKKETKAEEKHETKAEKKEMKSEHMPMHHGTAMHGSRLYDDSTRLAALLTDAQTKINVSPAVWKTIANESNVLANRIAAGARGANTRKAAAEARMHVREMHAAAMKGDADAARTHASQALPYLYTVIDASAPKSM